MNKFRKDYRSKFGTVGELRRLLSNLSGETPVYICGGDGWLHAPADFSSIVLDYSSMDECYEDFEEGDSNDGFQF